MIVGIAGRKGSGKTTLANAILDRFYGTRYSFAEPIKRAAMDWWDLPWSAVYGDDQAKNAYQVPVAGQTTESLSARQILQRIGTEVGRSIDADVWVKYGMRQAERFLKEREFHKHSSLFVIDDVRFPNEAQAILDRKGVVIVLTRGQSGDDHESESHFDTLPFTLMMRTEASAEEAANFATHHLIGRRIVPKLKETA